ncbi:uncharacterized protein LOC111326423 [Stylophora pistillata]|uniref:uncharacterized protein LOC111326423 n=1 Tax=Stylophora pistillata TaxID=50429 RepID=UPI000C041735|nr:uncharacterized protein LOC111326423 [Stylophora pistillata]
MLAEVQENEHFSLKSDNKTLDVRNALPSHSGNYTAFAVVMQIGSLVESVLSFTSFDLRVRDLYLKAVVRSPLVVQLGNNVILKVEKSALGTLVWKHNGNLLSGHEPHYAYGNPRKTELEISNAGPEQAGVYEVFLKEGGCEKRAEIQVQTGSIKIRPISSHSDICVGENTSFAVEVNNYFDDLDFHVIWRYNMLQVQENEHFSLKADNTVLNVHNALPSHSGNYTAFAVLMQNGSPVESVLSFTSFDLRVRDLYLKAVVRSPLVVQFGNNAILKVEKSVLGTLAWKHNGNLLSGHEPYYAYGNPQKTELEISNAGPEMAGVYEVFLKEGGCRKREEIQVHTGDIKIRPISSHSDICVGEIASFAVEVNNYFDDPLNFQVFWRYNMLTEVEENEHFSLKANNTTLDVHDALPSHSGNYTAFAVVVENGSLVENVLSFTSFVMSVHDVFLNASVESPIKIKAGDSTIFKVEKSDLGALFWTHDEELVDDKSPHYTLNANKTELEIVAARLEQAGIYEIVLKEGRCEISKVFEVQIYVAELMKDVNVLMKESKDAEDSGDSEFWAITYMILVYAEALRGFLFYKWYIAPAAGGVLLIVVTVLVNRFGRLGEKKKSPKENAETHSEAEKGQPSRHFVLKNPVVTLLKEVIYPSADQTFPASADNLTTNTCVGRENHIQSPSLDHYRQESHYSGIAVAPDSLVGPTVLPPTQEKKKTSSDGSDANYDSCDSF